MGLCSCLLPYKMGKFLGTIKSTPQNIYIYKIQHSREIWSSDVKLFKFRWWFHIFFIFSPIPGEMIQSDEHIFQMGWFNHHFLHRCHVGSPGKDYPEKLACAVFIPYIDETWWNPQFWLNKHRGTHIHIRIYVIYTHIIYLFVLIFLHIWYFIVYLIWTTYILYLTPSFISDDFSWISSAWKMCEKSVAAIAGNL